MKQIVNIETLGSSGDGVGHLETGEKAFIPYTLPGEVVEAAIERSADGVVRGVVQNYVVSSKARAVPPCRHFTKCGGCALQHLSDNDYRVFKQALIEDALSRQGVSLPDKINAIYLPPLIRRRANFAATISHGKPVIGFHRRRSSILEDTPDCLLVQPEILRIMNIVRPFLAGILPEGKKMDVMIQIVDGQVEIGFTAMAEAPAKKRLAYDEALSDIMRETGAVRVCKRKRDYEPYETILETGPVLKRFGGITVDLAPCSFLQPSDEGEETLVRLVCDEAAGFDSVYDLFCGNGTFTGWLLKSCQNVVAMDNAVEAVESLRRSGVNAVVRNLFKEPVNFENCSADCVVIDPPRAGAAAQAGLLAESDVRKIVYVSCNPVTFARDAASLCQDGRRRLTKLTLVDQFNWSNHVELVAVFEKY